MNDELVATQDAVLGASEVLADQERALYPNAGLAVPESAQLETRPAVKLRLSLVDRVSLLVGGVLAGVAVFLIAIGGLIFFVEPEPDGPLGFAIMGLLGGIFLVASTVLGLTILVRRRRVDRLIKRGHRIEAEIVGVTQGPAVDRRSMFTWQVRALGYVPGSERRVPFLSDGFQQDPSWVLKEAAITTLPVYIDTEDPRKYHVDDTELRSWVGVK